MELFHPRCAGLDVGKDEVVACVRVQERREVRHECRTFATTTRALLALVDWLTAERVTAVAMEATGPYWKPVWHVVDGAMDTLILANPAHVRGLPGRKSDVNDATWIADLLAHGLIRGSFVPPTPVQQLRDLTRTRKQLMREIAQHTLRLQKTLEDANLKLTGVVSDVLGLSARAMIRALIAGDNDPARLADLAHGTLKNKRTALLEALTGRVTPHPRLLLRVHLDLIETIETVVTDLDRRIEVHLAPFRPLLARLTAIPGLSDVAAPAVLGEIGWDMTAFASDGHLVSWAGLCPLLDSSAGKRKSNRTRQGAPWLKTIMVQAAWGAVRCRNSYFRAQFLRLRARRGPKKAIVAVAASLLTAIYHVLRENVEYRDLGPDHFDRTDRNRMTQRLVRRLQSLGYQVQLQKVAA